MPSPSTTTTVCQGLQSCLDPLLQEPRIVTHHFTPTKLDLSSSPWPQNQIPIPLTGNPKCHFPEKDCKNSEKSWNFIHSLTKSSYNCTKLSDGSEQQVYVHPLDKRSTSSLSSRSLEMCTESLGSETGSGIALNIEEFSCLPFGKQSSRVKKKAKTPKVKHSSSFPPPLTSINGSEGVQVQTHREGGRLVIKAFSFTSSSSCFQAERGNGRLRLSLLKTEDHEVEEKEADEESGYKAEVKAVKAEADFSGYEAEVKAVNTEAEVKAEADFGGRKIGNGDWSIIRCNGDMNGSKRMPSLQFCVAIS